MVCHDEAFLVTDKEICKVGEIPVVLVAAFHVFNICYPTGCKNFYSLLEVIILGNSINKTTTSVKHMYASLQPRTSPKAYWLLRPGMHCLHMRRIKRVIPLDF